jgi:hypothetical protein
MPCTDCKVRVKINKDMPGYIAGTTVSVEVRDNVPVSKFWRDRFRDAELDNCVSVIKSKPAKSKKVKDD